jgi:tricorn protease
MGIFFVSISFAQSTPLWLRYPAISPDGKQIVFSYKGDLCKVASSGGAALPLTMHTAQDYMPVWSHDGKWIAFASDRFGNFDVYVMPSEGGDPKRLTYNSVADYPWDFSPDDKHVIFGSGRNDLATSVRFPVNGVFQKLYTVPVTGGRSIMISAAGMQNAHYNKNGDKIIFQDNKGFEDPWRKHHTSSITRDIWTYDIKSKDYKKLTSFEGEDREPVFASDDQSYYYLNEKSGSLNVYKASVSAGGEKQLTNFKNNPVRFLSRSNNNTLCFAYDGEIYTMNEGGTPKKVNIIINSENKSNTEHVLTINGGATEFELSPNGKEIAFVFRGEVFVTSVDGGITKRITNTPYQERTVTFGPDGRTLYYAAERSNGWDIMKSTISRKEEPYFYASTVINETPVIATDKEEFQPAVSPNGKEIAYLEERNILKVFDLDKKTSRTIIPAGQNFSYADGDQSFSWSPDSKWIAAQSSKGNYGSSEIVLYKTDGTDVGTDITTSGFGDFAQQWALNGKALLWATDKEGKRPLAYQGARELDIYAMFFDKETYDKYKLNKEDYALLKEKEDKDKSDTSKKTDTALARKIKEPFKMDVTDLDTRRVRLTNSSVNLSDYRMTPTGEKLFFTARFEQGYDLWVVDPRTHELKTLAKLGANNASLDMSKDGKTLYVLSDGKISKVETESGKVTPIIINGEMVQNDAEEREYIFNHAWRQFKKKFYDPKLHGVDWDMYRKTYAKFLPHITNNYDFRELLSEMLGEVNASHTGGRYTPQVVNGDATASLGLLYDETVGGNGLKIMEVISGGPLDKANSKIRAGQTIQKIDGESITGDFDWAKLLNRKANRNVLLTVSDPAMGTFEEVIKPISATEENNLLYRRWTNKIRDIVDKLSGGKVGYVHVQAMNDRSYRNVYDEVLGKNINKDALIVDTRFNGGGWLHEDLSNFLSGKQYIKYAPYGFTPSGGGEPQGKWWKPSCVVMNEANYSDAHMFPYVYKTKGIGKLIGMPVPGTGTAVWWETQIDPTMVFGIPMIASIGLKENRPLENLQLEPDIRVQNDYNKVLNGEDQQIEAAVKEMLKEIKEK